MAETTTIQVRLPAEHAARLDALAEATQRSRSFLAAAAIEAYLAEQAWQVKAIGEAVAAADAGGPFVEHEEVDAGSRAGARTRSLTRLRRRSGARSACVSSGSPTPATIFARFAGTSPATIRLPRSKLQAVSAPRPDSSSSSPTAAAPAAGPARASSSVTGRPYLLPYRVQGGAIEILRVLYGRQGFPEE